MNGHLIKKVLPGSIAAELEVEAGDRLLAVNDEEIEDVFDYRFLVKDEYLTVLVEKPDGEQWELEIEKDYDEDLGIVFENDLMSGYHSCRNRCIFCFIDQMPPDMRETLYFKDDDSRLSFLQGNYVTLTNMSEKDIDRIIRFHLAPINISVHTTNPELRCRMLNNRFAGRSLSYLKKLCDHQIEMNGQIVLCRGINDGAELARTIGDLSSYLPFLRSVSVVPAGITKYRENLYPLELFTKEEAGSVIDYIEGRQKEFYERYGLHFVHASDEFYALAERPYPEEGRYDGYVQLENGVGMMRLLREEFTEALAKRVQSPRYKSEKHLCRRITIATGYLAADMIRELAAEFEKAYPGIDVRVTGIRNDFFGETITVSGLITGQDLTGQMKKIPPDERGDVLLISSNMLRMGEDVFLDDMTLQEAGETLAMKIVPVDSRGEDLLSAFLEKDYHMRRDNSEFVYVKAYGKL